MLLFILPGLLAVFIQPVVSATVNYAYAVDIDKAMTASTFNCFKKSGYNAVFIRAYNPQGSGLFDANAPNNIRSAYSAGLGTEVFMTPQPKSAKTGAAQFKEMIDGLKKANINVRTVWVQVTSPVNWGADSKTNIAFLNDIAKTAIVRISSSHLELTACQCRADANADSIDRLYCSSGITIGYYTSVYDWNQITKNTPVTGTNIPLWYWNVNGGGPSGETPANFNDFRAFGGFTQAMVKQFGQQESICGVVANRDVYNTAAKKLFAISKMENGMMTIGL
ncbi:unnamed protein product [Cylicostephanus goldi]|uniref:Lysozyme n=1 Tax=Cylicostephanus goldi TaxID=71465 RepID=A0A3P6R204_CYLGO|nr:unnamed protein product [Cylicostephanus goldi]